MTPRSFLPQIVGVSSHRSSVMYEREADEQLFYATFDPRLGPIVQHQVPEDLITSRSRTGDDALSQATSRSRSRSRSRARLNLEFKSPPRSRSHSRSSSISDDEDALLDFAPISEYVIPKKSLHGKLVTMLTTSRLEGETEEYRIMGFPAIITDEGGGRYKRNEYMWNLCFVFHASSSLEAFEPVVRKVGRILKAAEVSSCSIPRMGS